MTVKIQEKIDELEKREDFAYIILAYGYCSGGVEGLKTKLAKLVVPKIHDCIPLLLGETTEEIANKAKNETIANFKNNRDKTYYLSRGWIDCGGDVYKQYLHLTNNMQDWIDRFADFQKKNKQAVVDWQNNDSYHFRRKYSEEDAEFISFECLKGYEMVTLIDNDNLAPIHRDYAKEKFDFVDSLLLKYRGRGIEYIEIKGNLDFLDSLLLPENYSYKKFEGKTGEGVNELLIFSPGEELKLRKHLLK